MTPNMLMSKAVRAVASARLLLDAGDVDGACNRAYYAMFDAAKAALIKLMPGIDPALAKTHSGLISAFSLNLVKTGKLPMEMGKALNRAHEIRQIADYTGDEVGIEQARSLIEQANLFVETIQARIQPAPSDGMKQI